MGQSLIPKGARYAAHEVEAGVFRALRGFLDRPAAILSALEIEPLSPKRLKSLVARAERLRAELADPKTASRPIQKVLSSVEVADTNLNLHLRLGGLAAALGIQGETGVTTFAFATPCQLVRRGQELKFVLPNSGDPEEDTNRDSTLLMAVAKAHLWWRWLRDGEVGSLREIASREGLSPAQVTRRLRLAFLSPRLVKQILDGTQRADLTAEMLTRQVELPLAWATQDRLLA